MSADREGRSTVNPSRTNALRVVDEELADVLIVLSGSGASVVEERVDDRGQRGGVGGPPPGR